MKKRGGIHQTRWRAVYISAEARLEPTDKGFAYEESKFGFLTKPVKNRLKGRAV